LEKKLELIAIFTCITALGAIHQPAIFDSWTQIREDMTRLFDNTDGDFKLHVIREKRIDERMV
jgi:hypothetical protein